MALENNYLQLIRNNSDNIKLSLKTFLLGVKRLTIFQIARDAFIIMKLFTTVEDNFFMPHGFISLATHTTSILACILSKSLLKLKRAHIYIKQHQSSCVQNLWWCYLIKAHGSSSWHIISFFSSWSKFLSLIRRTLGVLIWKANKFVQ